MAESVLQSLYYKENLYQFAFLKQFYCSTLMRLLSKISNGNFLFL